MKSAPLLLFAMLCFFSSQTAFAQSCPECRYLSPMFDSVTVETVKFGQGPNAAGDMQELFMDIYQPYGDTMTNRPVAIFAFGGAFITGSRDDWYVILVCEHLARAGYVVASIDYRIYDGIDGMLGEILTGQHMRIFFRPMQDMRAAVQYLKADFAELGNNYNIDTSRILIGGASSGGITSMMMAYCDKESEIAEMGINGSLAPLDDLGGFNSSSGLYPSYSWQALGAFNVSGAMINADWVEAGDIPLVSAHGDADQVVPFKSGNLGGLTAGLFDLQGSYIVDSVARAKGVCSYLYNMEGKDHPSESFGIEYLKSVVYRIMLHLHPIVNGRSFCCPLNAAASVDDTIRYNPAVSTFDVTATLANDNGNAQIQWCGIPCLVNEGTSNITLQPDTGLHYIYCIASEGACQSGQLNMVKVDPTVSIRNMVQLPSGDFTMIPHPAADVFTLHLQGYEAGEKAISIFDLSGRLVLSHPIGAYVKTEAINVKSLDAGSYIIRLETKGFQSQEKKLVVLK